jgi:hypothetical protein
MDANAEIRERPTGKRSAFTIMSSVRDHCQQPVGKKLLMLTLATYANADGICYPSNETLAKATGLGNSTVRRMLRQLKSEGELEILTPGTGRDQKRTIRLKRYVAKPLTAMSAKPITVMSGLNCSGSPGKTPCNSHMEQPTNNQSSAHAEFVRLWCERFETVTGERYAFQGGKDGKAVKLLLTTTGLTPAQLVAIAEKAWKRPTGFWCKFATSIAGYNARFNQIRKETTDAMAITTSGRDAGRLARARRSQYAGVGKLR